MSPAPVAAPSAAPHKKPSNLAELLMLVPCLFAAFLAIRSAPDTLVGKALRRFLVEWPAERLLRVTRGQLVCGIFILATMAVALLLLEADALRMIGLALPETMVWFTTFEISTFVDILVALTLVSAHTRLRSARHGVRAALGAVRRPGGARRRERRSRPARARKAANDDVAGPAWVYAMAA
jgi:hypothetical protein